MVGILIRRAILFGVYIRAPDFWMGVVMVGVLIRRALLFGVYIEAPDLLETPQVGSAVP